MNYTSFKSGEFQPGLYGWSAQVNLKLHGGGNDEKLGVNLISVSILQNGTRDTLTGHYAAAAKHTMVVRESINVSWPVLDAQWDGNPLFETAGMIQTDNPQAQDRVLHVGDSPAGGFYGYYDNDSQKYPNNRLRSISGVNAFRNAVTSHSSQSPGEYVVHGTLQWTADYGGTVDANGIYHVASANVSTDPHYTANSPGTGGQDAQLAGFETRPPIYIAEDANHNPTTIVTHYESH